MYESSKTAKRKGTVCGEHAGVESERSSIKCCIGRSLLESLNFSLIS